MSAAHTFSRRAKAVAERALGVTISRERPAPPNKHADHALAGLRRWASTDVVFDVRAHHLALGAVQHRATIYLGAMSVMNSLTPGWTADPVGTEEVEVTTVDRVMADERLPHVHFLKVDTEGHELDVLRGAEAARRNGRIGIIQLEVGIRQLWKKMLSLEEARTYLAPRGYRLYGIYNQCLAPARAPADRPAQERGQYRAQVLAYCDALFIRADLP